MERSELFDAAWRLSFTNGAAAREMLRPWCEAGDADALCLAADTFPRDVGNPIDRQAMLSFYEQAFARRHARAAFELGLIYSGAGDRQRAASYSRCAFEWFVVAARRGDAAAAKGVADCYLVGLGVEADEAERLRWLECAAEGGQVLAILELYHHYARLGSDRGRAYYDRLKDLGCGVPYDAQYEMAPIDQDAT